MSSLFLVRIRADSEASSHRHSLAFHGLSCMSGRRAAQQLPPGIAGLPEACRPPAPGLQHSPWGFRGGKLQPSPPEDLLTSTQDSITLLGLRLPIQHLPLGSSSGFLALVCLLSLQIHGASERGVFLLRHLPRLPPG